MVEIVCVGLNEPEFGYIRDIRHQVFVDEQGVSPASEFDAIDGIALHFLARVDGVALGTARLYAEAGLGRIGRVAVLAEARGRGVGAALMDAALVEARRLGYCEVLLHAQVRVRGFYERAGFQAEGEVYFEEGIPHITMRLELASASLL